MEKKLYEYKNITRSQERRKLEFKILKNKPTKDFVEVWCPRNLKIPTMWLDCELGLYLTL